MMWLIFKCHLFFCSTVKTLCLKSHDRLKVETMIRAFLQYFYSAQLFYRKVLNCVASKEFPLSSFGLPNICLAWNEQWIQITFWLNEWFLRNLICDWMLGNDFWYLLKIEFPHWCHWCLFSVEPFLSRLHPKFQRLLQCCLSIRST